MSTTIPSLRAIQTFEVAARHLSFTQAAEELGVTPGAVSRQIRSLEEFFNQSLFQRQHRGVVLTHLGATYLQGISQHFGEIRKLTEAMVQKPGKQTLHIMSSQTFAIRWLMPRLSDFYSRFSKYDVTLTTSSKPLNFSETHAHVAIRLGTGNWKSMVSYPLVTFPIAPVCSPAYLEQIGGIHSVEDFAKTTILHSNLRADDWRAWFTHVGFKGSAAREMGLENSALTYQAAIEGLGFTLAQLPLIEQEMARGDLVMPWPVTLDDLITFYLIFPNAAPRGSALKNFEKWIISAANAE